MNKFFLLGTLALVLFSCSNQEKPKATNPKSDQKAVSSKRTTMIAPVRLNNQWMYINQAGEHIFDKSVYTHAGDFSDGLTCTSTDGMRQNGTNAVFGATYQAMDTKGNIVKGIKSDMPFVFSEGVAMTSWGSEKILIDTKGKVLRKEIIQADGDASNGLILVMYPDYKLEYWDTKGNTVLTFTDIGAMGNFSEGMAYFKNNGVFGYMDKSGKIAKNESYLFASSFEDGVARVQKEDGWYIIDNHFKELAGPFISIVGYSEGVFQIETKDGWSFFDKNGEQVTPDFYEAIDPFSEGKAIVLVKTGEIAMIDKQGNKTKVDAKMIFPFKNGLALAEKNGKMGYVDSNGKWVVEPKYERVSDFYKLK